MALSVPLSRFTPRVGGGSAFFVRPMRRLSIICSLLILPLIMSGCCTHSDKDISFQTKSFSYAGDLEDIAATPRIVAIRSADSPYISVIDDLLKIDLKPLTEQGTLLVFTESCTITRVQERLNDSEIWVFTENRRPPDADITGQNPSPSKHVLGVAIIPHSTEPLFFLPKESISEN